MKTQKLQNTSRNVQRTTGNLGLWLGLGVLLLVAALAIQTVSRQAAIIPDTGSPSRAQSVPEAGVQSVTDYLRVHSSSPAQAVPEAGVQSVADYLRVHNITLPEATTTDPAAQSVLDYIRLHSNDPSTILITDPAARSVMDYLKAHGIQP
jgi:hypothetical protein